ncbi:MAG TPA: PD-(D/E)XK nuclease family protein [Acidimicrobiia bacterium]|nr:PD-(D/E)XK nuclease family protein [Acidimicrobiia bacterium]
MSRSRALPDIVPVSPTSFDSWLRCPRLHFNEHVLGTPPSDPSPSPDHGLLVHELLRFVHAHGSCHDDDAVRDALESHGCDDDVYRGVLARHARRCPSGAVESSAHEVDLARFHRLPPPMFMATARIDAVWVHDGILDARDYKTGRVTHLRVGDDPRARVQAHVLAPQAERRGLRLRLRYEHLAADAEDDPEPFEPDADDLAAIDEELRGAVEAMWRTERWTGVRDEAVCRWCRYRSICPDSAAVGEPVWPALLVGGPADDDQ